MERPDRISIIDPTHSLVLPLIINATSPGPQKTESGTRQVKRHSQTSGTKKQGTRKSSYKCAPKFDPGILLTCPLCRSYSVSNEFDNAYVDYESEMPAWFMAFYAQYIREREKINAMLQNAVVNPARRSIHQKNIEPPLSAGQDLENGTVDPDVLRKMSLNITLLEGGILFHSVFVGMTVSLETEGFIVLLIAILFHQAFEGLGLGSRIAAVPYPKGSLRPWILIVAFGTTAPIGQAIGLMARSSYDPESAFALILVGTFNAMYGKLFPVPCSVVYWTLLNSYLSQFLRSPYLCCPRGSSG